MTELKQYIKENPTHDLVAIQSHSTTKQRVFSPDLMLAALTEFDHIDLLDTPLENSNTSMTKEAKALRKAFHFGSEFNLIEGHPSNIRPLFKNMLDNGEISTSFYQYCLWYSNEPNFPLYATTQEDVDAVKADLALYGETAPSKVGYPIVNPDLDYALTLANRPIKFAVMLVSPAVVDTKFAVYAHTDYSNTKAFEAVGKLVGYIYVKQGESSGSFDYTKSLSRKIQASAVCNVICEYNLIVQAS